MPLAEGALRTTLGQLCRGRGRVVPIPLFSRIPTVGITTTGLVSGMECRR